MDQDMETFAARLASFDRVLQPEKRRSSTAKSAKPVAWPHRRPSPAELAHAGFFYNPYETNPDNTTCFQCSRALDGWEEEDNPITEHLKHSSDCGWAVMVDIQQHSSNPAEIEDPTSDRITQARQATFGARWPHDGKRGWVCQSEKMVEGGWYFCPNEESADLASCAYCKLSLDGWEPKDDPFDEHYRRSSDCSFFVFAQPPGKKTKSSRSKKGRVSKASRLSTQSVATTTSEAPTLDQEDPMDDSIMSQSTSKAKGTKKASKSKTKGTKSKKNEAVETGSQIDVESADPEPEAPKPKRTNRGKKRSSEDVGRDDQEIADAEDTEQTEPPAKKRATKSRTSAAQQESRELQDEDMPDVQEQDEDALQEEEPKKKGRGTKKSATTKGRKVSETPAPPKESSKSRAPRDSELDTALEAGLEEGQAQVEEPQEEITRKPSKKSKSTKKAKSAQAEPVPEPEEAVEPSEEHEQRADENRKSSQVRSEIEVPENKKESSKSAGKRKTKTKSIEQEDTARKLPEPRASPEVDATRGGRSSSVGQHESFISVEITNRAPQEEPEVDTDTKAAKKKAPKKKASTDKVKKSKKTERVSAERSESRESAVGKDDPKHSTEEQDPVDVVGYASESRPQEDSREKDSDKQPARRRSSGVPPKTAERYSDISQDKQFARSFTGSRSSNVNVTPGENNNMDENDVVSPLPSASRGTPSLSPQSSDAENRPPSTNPRTHLLSPSKQQTARVPLAASTPSPSKRNANLGGLKTSHPWMPVDIDEVLFAGASDKENFDFTQNMKGALSSPEKKMTVEEWIRWNAKNGEDRLKQECERLVGQFEKEGGRAMRVLEGIECID